MGRKEQNSTGEERFKYPIEVSANVYREGVEAILMPILADPESNLLRQLEAGKPAFIKANWEDDRKEHRLIPIALPIDYKESGELQRDTEGRAHNITQIYLNKAFRRKDIKVVKDGKTVVVTEIKEIDESLEQIGDLYYYTRERIRQLKNEAFGDAHQRSGKSDIPIKFFGFGKHSTDASQNRKSASHGGKTSTILDQSLNGVSYPTLRKGFSVRQLSRARIEAQKKYGIVVPRSPDDRSWSDVIEVLTNIEVDRSKKRELIKEIPASMYQTYSKATGKIPFPIFVSIKEIANAASFSISNRHGETASIASFLEERGLPVGQAEQIVKSGKQKGTKTYRFILAQDFDEAVEMLREARVELIDRISKNPVRAYITKATSTTNAA